MTVDRAAFDRTVLPVRLVDKRQNGAPLITVVTPTKDRLVLLRKTMDSVRQQSLQAWEHIVVDDGSDDGTAEEVLRRAQEDSRVRYLPRSGELSGANPCRNQGVAEASAKLIVFLDSDDLLEPDCLAKRVKVMARNKDIDFAVSRTGVFLQTPGDLGRELDPEMIGDDLLRFLYFETPWQTTAATWRLDALQRLGGFDETLPSWQDVDLHVRAIAAGFRYLRFPQVDHHMRWQEDPAKVSTQQRRSPNHLETAEGLLAKFERVVREGPGMTWVRQRALCSLYFFIAERWVDAGRTPAALACWRQIRRRRLGPVSLYTVGAGLLLLRSLGSPGHRLSERIGNKWKGWVRLRTNPELVSP